MFEENVTFPGKSDIDFCRRPPHVQVASGQEVFAAYPAGHQLTQPMMQLPFTFRTVNSAKVINDGIAVCQGVVVCSRVDKTPAQVAESPSDGGNSSYSSKQGVKHYTRSH